MSRSERVAQRAENDTCPDTPKNGSEIIRKVKPCVKSEDSVKEYV